MVYGHPCSWKMRKLGPETSQPCPRHIPGTGASPMRISYNKQETDSPGVKVCQGGSSGISAPGQSTFLSLPPSSLALPPFSPPSPEATTILNCVQSIHVLSFLSFTTYICQEIYTLTDGSLDKVYAKGKIWPRKRFKQSGHDCQS